MNKHLKVKDKANTTYQARTPKNNRQVAMETAHARHHTRTSVSERQVSMDTAQTAHEGSTPVNKRQLAIDITHTSTRRLGEVQVTKANTAQVGHTGATQPIHRASGRGVTPGPLV